MKLSILYILSISLLLFLQCKPDVSVTFNDVQIDTLKLHRIARQKTVKGKLLTWRDTAKAIASGKVIFVKKPNTNVQKGDTVMYLNMRNLVNSPRQKWIDHSAIKSLNKKVKMLQTTLQRIEKLKQYSSQKHTLEESDIEQLAVSLEFTGIKIEDLHEHIDFESISKGIKQQIKRLKLETAKLEKQIQNDEIDLGRIPLISEATGKIEYLVSGNELVEPGDPLFYVKDEDGENIVIKLEQIPNEDLLFTINVKMNDEVLNLNLDGLEEENQILRVAGDIMNSIELTNNTVRVCFESEPTEKLLIKRTAIYEKDNRHYVFVKRNDIFEAVNIKPGRIRGSMVEILDGLQPNDQIIVSSSKPIWHMSHLEIKK